MATSQDSIDKKELSLQEKDTKEANITATDDDDGVVALMSATQSGQTGTVQSLLQKGVKVDAIGKDGGTALMLASQDGHTDTVLLLLVHGAHVDTQDTEGMTALHLACLEGHTDIVRHLLEYGASLESHSHRDVTPLLLACQHGHVDIVDLFLSKDAKTNTQDADGRFPLLAATNNGHKEVLESLLEGGADVNMQNNQGYSALMVGCLKGEEECVKLLQRRGADCNVQRSNGTIALDIAREKKHFNIEHILVDGRADNQSSKHASRQALYGVSRSISEPRPRISIASKTLSCDYPPTTNSITQSAIAGDEVLGDNKPPFMAQSDAMGTVPINIELPYSATKGANVHLFVHVTCQTENQRPISSHPGVRKFPYAIDKDVKSQPSSDGSLSISQLQTIQTALWDVRPKWKHLGIQLQLDPDTIDVVQQQNHFQIEQCFTEMLTRWLKHEGQSSPTLESLIEALGSLPVNYPHLVRKLKQSLSTL